VSTSPWINHLCTEAAFLFSAPYTWYHQHIVGHHSFPNVQGKDPDLYHSPKFTRHSSDIRVTKYHSIQAYIFPVIWAVGIPLGLILRGSLDVIKGKSYNKVVKLSESEQMDRRSLYPRLFFLALTLCAPMAYHGLTLKGLVFSVIPYLLYSICFMICSQINHLTPETDEQFSKNFYEHQILTGHNVAINNYFVYLFTGGLNMQIEHHLFPSVNHCHLRVLAPKVKALCEKHGVQYNESPSLTVGLYKHVQHMFKFCGLDDGSLKKRN
jgi:fatty acid desaturase